MEIKDYCKNVDMELTEWKTKVYDVLCKMDAQSTANKQRMYEDVNGLHIVMAEFDDRIDQLRTECPIAWKPEQEKIWKKFPELSSRYNDTAGVLFDYDYGG
jgi:hypothetical protein